jgi:hypothetical protein
MPAQELRTWIAGVDVDNLIQGGDGHDALKAFSELALTKAQALSDWMNARLPGTWGHSSRDPTSDDQLQR